VTSNAHAAFASSNSGRLRAKHGMENESGPPAAIRGVVRWAITPPQSYVVYLVALFLVAGSSFYIGTLKPKKAIGLGSPPISAPRN
jgi:hypothetical protein